MDELDFDCLEWNLGFNTKFIRSLEKEYENLKWYEFKKKADIITTANYQARQHFNVIELGSREAIEEYKEKCGDKHKSWNRVFPIFDKRF